MGKHFYYIESIRNGGNGMINYIVKAGDIQTIAHEIWFLSQVMGKNAKLSDIVKLEKKTPGKGAQN